jgi:hypothetical protein
MQSLRERAIAEYHELLAADETVTSATFRKLRRSMRNMVDKVAGIEKKLGIYDLAQFTPKVANS